MLRIRRTIFSGLTIASASCLWLTACGGSSDNASGPTGVASITLTVSNPDVIASFGDTRTIVAVAKDAAGAAVSTPALTWTSNAPAVATVSGSGAGATVTAIGNGTAIITASSGSLQATTTVTVLQRATSIGITGLPSTLIPGATAQLSASARDALGGAMPAATGFTFASSDQSVAVVSATGLVTAIAPGVAQVSGSATVAGTVLNGSSAVSVAFATVTNPATAAVAANDSRVFSPASVTIATGGTVTWSFGTVAHNTIFGTTTGAPTNIPITSAAQVSRSFPTAGRFDYVCSLHQGMTGTVIVQANGATGFTTILNGANEKPAPVTTQGAGAALFTVSGATVSYTVTFSRLSGAPTGAHIHGPGSATQAVGVLVDFPTTGQTLTNGVLTGTFNGASIRNAAVSLDSLLVLMRNGNAYVNVHTTLNPAGEIRGQLSVPQ